MPLFYFAIRLFNFRLLTRNSAFKIYYRRRHYSYNEYFAAPADTRYSRLC